LITLIVIVSVVGGVFFIVIKNNVNGLAEKYRNNLKNIPVLRMALPPPPADYDPLDPKISNWMSLSKVQPVPERKRRACKET